MLGPRGDIHCQHRHVQPVLHKKFGKRRGDTGDKLISNRKTTKPMVGRPFSQMIINSTLLMLCIMYGLRKAFVKTMGKRM